MPLETKVPKPTRGARCSNPWVQDALRATAGVTARLISAVSNQEVMPSNASKLRVVERGKEKCTR